jgi:hypothetical protein
MRQALLVAIFGGLACRAVVDVEGAQKAANHFLEALSRNDVAEAYSMVAPEWRAQVDQAAFEKVLLAGSLVSARFEPVVWHGSAGNTARFTSTVATPEGPMTVELFLLHGWRGWGIARIRSPGYPWPTLPPMTAELRRQLPPVAELQNLLFAVIHAEKKALVDGDASELQQISVHPGAARDLTNPLPKIDTSALSSAVEVHPILIAAEVSGPDKFRIDAIYPSRPKLQLRPTFERLNGAWKLGYFRMRAVP